jgi:hypothetical protein
LKKIAPHLKPAGIEASMRLEYRTLDHLPHSKFVEEAALAEMCEEEKPGYLKEIAESMGLGDDFAKWECSK